MVPDSRTPVRPDALRSLNCPRPMMVLTRRGQDGNSEPAALVERERWAPVERVEEMWCVEDKWWREQPISRAYYRLALVGGAVRTVYHDRITDAWYAQAY